MSTANPWIKFKRLLQGEGRAVVTVASNNGDGTSTVCHTRRAHILDDGRKTHSHKRKSGK